MSIIRFRAASLAAALILAACGGDDTPAPPPPRLTDLAPCPDRYPLQCGTLQVPLDHAGRQPGTLSLKVAMSPPADAPRGVLLMLAGGPGQPAVDFLLYQLAGYPVVAEGYRLVALDQRGTGENALDCPALQEQLGSSDVRAARAADIDACGRSIGTDRQFYATSDTVQDMEYLRRALEADTWTLDGTSYGTYVATQYAMAYPQRVARLVLDSVVPHTGLSMFMLPTMQATAGVLRDVCAEQACDSDPAADLAALVAAGDEPVALIDLVTSLSVIEPAMPGLPAALAEARAGHPDRLHALMARVGELSAADASELSQALHTATLCQDMTLPWGDSATPLHARQPALEAAAAQLTQAQTWPFDAATATALGTIRNCLAWPPTPPGKSVASGMLPNVPTLLLAGGRDLSTPLAEARRQAELAPGGTVVVIPEAGHSVQGLPVGRDVVTNFLCGGPVAYPLAPADVAGTCGQP